jgi:S-disulfanyl-L-cysteine oxidoreductase SoxD
MRHACVLVALVSTVACGGEVASSGGTWTGAPADGAPAVRFADLDAGTVPGGPGAGARYGIGAVSDAKVIAAMDLDIGPDGTELPAGRGTVAQGDALYKAQCAMCHGQKGEGMEPAFPRLLGRDPAAEGFKFAADPKLPHTIGNYWSHATTLFDYIKRAMPHTTPGSLTSDQTYALTAYLLAMDDVIADDAMLDAASLRAVKMPYADRYVPDDRRPGPAK